MARAQSSKTAQKALQIYYVDVAGGAATLYVFPNHLSLLIDTGWPGLNGRDADRIVAAAKQAGLKRIDYVLITHYHIDHVGGVPQLVARIPVGTFFDHGPDREKAPVRGWQVTKRVYDAYQKVLATGKYKHVVLHAGEKLPVKGIDATVVTGDGKVISKPLPGAGAPNPYCGAVDKMPADVAATEVNGVDMTENGRALGLVINYGKVRIVALGDLTWDRERSLMCPVNKIGHANIYLLSNHGMLQSDSPAIVYGLAPQVAIMDNGNFKGGAIRVFETVKNSPGHPVLWQLHYAERAGNHNVSPARIANLKGPTGPRRGPKQIPDKGYMLKVTAYPDGHFSILNERTNKTTDYMAN